MFSLPVAMASQRLFQKNTDQGVLLSELAFLYVSLYFIHIVCTIFINGLYLQEAGGVVEENREINMVKLYKMNPEILAAGQIPMKLADAVGFIT